ncbi:MAG: antibiotic biosynthesis monooxygenase [Actinomycetes bacterium]
MDPVPNDVATIVIHHRVDPDRNAEFNAWQDQVLAAVQQFPGFLGAERVPPVPGAQPVWTIILRFASLAQHDVWRDSPIRHQLQADAPQFADFDIDKHVGTFAGWIPTTIDGNAPKWKSATAVLTAFYPTAVLLTYTVVKLLTAANITALWATALLVNAAGVAFLTWVVMPLLVKVIGFWLVPSRDISMRANVLGAGICVGFMILTGIIAWAIAG